MVTAKQLEAAIKLASKKTNNLELLKILNSIQASIRNGAITIFYAEAILIHEIKELLRMQPGFISMRSSMQRDSAHFFSIEFTDENLQSKTYDAFSASEFESIIAAICGGIFWSKYSPDELITGDE